MKLRLHQTIRFRLCVMVIILIGFPMVFLSTFGFSNYQRKMEANMNTAMEQALQQTVMSTNNIIDMVIAASNAILLDEEIVEILKSELSMHTQFGELFSFHDSQMLDRKIATIQTTFLMDNYANITIMDFKGRVYRNWSSLKSVDHTLATDQWYETVKASKGNLIWIAPHFAYDGVESKANSYISLGRLIRTSSYTHNLGVLLISIRSDDLYKRLFSQALDTNDSMTIIVNDQGEILATKDSTLLGRRLPDDICASLTDKGTFLSEWENKKIWITFSTVRRTSWKILRITDYHSMMKDIYNMRYVITLITFILLTCFVGMATFMIINFTRPLEQIGKLMRSVENGSFDVSFPVTRKDEIGQLSMSFNHMVLQLRQLINQLKINEERKKTLELQALQAQINPHFLFNTLNMIKMTANLNQDVAVENMLIALGNLLELSMKKTAELIPLQKEIHAIESYVLIQKIKYSNRLNVLYHIAPETQQSLIVKFSLQPIIENSFIHGFDETHRYLQITISSKKIEKKVQITIENDGACIPENKIRQIMHNTIERSVTGYSGIGLANVNERIKLHYGEEYGVYIDNKPDGRGVITTILIPLGTGD